jgi:anti-sigma B factor antagonist
MTDRPLQRMPLRQLLTHSQKCARDLADYLRESLCPGTSEFRKLSRPHRKHSPYPSVTAVRDSLARVQQAGAQAGQLATYLLQRLDELHVHCQRPANPWIEVSQVDQARVATIIPKLVVDRQPIQELRTHLTRLAAQANDHPLVVDFSNVIRLASPVLAGLTAARLKAKAVGGQFALCSLHPEIRELFELTALDKTFTIYKDKEEALHGFSLDVPDGRSR